MSSTALLRPWRVTPMGAMAAILPQGRGSLGPVGTLVDAVCPRGAWAAHAQTWASCAIPGWYAPVRIGGRRYVDGGACSPTSLDLVVGLELDEVVVLSPMTSLEYDHPASVAGRIERRVRRLVTRHLVGEVKKVAATGIRVTLLGPGAQDLAAIGANLMDPRRRSNVLETALRTSTAALRAAPLADAA